VSCVAAPSFSPFSGLPGSSLIGCPVFGVHYSLIPNDLNESTKREIHNELASVIHHGTRPLTIAEWQGLLEAEGFSVQAHAQAPMHLLEPWRLIQDEGIFGALRFAFNLLCNREARLRACETIGFGAISG
jgi:hypothetical protein